MFVLSSKHRMAGLWSQMILIQKEAKVVPSSVGFLDRLFQYFNDKGDCRLLIQQSIELAVGRLLNLINCNLMVHFSTYNLLIGQEIQDKMKILGV